MPIRLSKSWCPALRAIAKIQLSGKLPDWEFLWATYTHSQRKAVREMKCQLLLKEKRQADWDVLRRVTKPISDEAVQTYCAKRYPHIYKE